MLNPLEEILLVGYELENASVFAKILEGLITLDTFLLLLRLFLETTRLTDGMLAFTNHYRYALIFVVRVLTGNTCESCIIH